jgi:hypothetical protein
LLHRQGNFLKSRPNLRFPFIPPRIYVFRVDVFRRVKQSCMNLFEAVRFLSAILDPIYLNMPSLEKADGLLAANISLCVSAFRFWVKFLFS